MNIIHDEGDEVEVEYHGYDIILIHCGAYWDGDIWSPVGEYVAHVNMCATKEDAFAEAKGLVRAYIKRQGR